MRARLAFAFLMALQFVCGLFLLWNILSSIFAIETAPISWAVLELIEVGAVAGLILGAIGSAYMVLQSRRRQVAAEQSLRAASGAFLELLEDRFDDWKLTPAERDVALFAIKGLSLAEIAGMRNTSQGTVKAQTNAIYRKAGVSGRPQLLSLFIDDLMGEAIVAEAGQAGGLSNDPAGPSVTEAKLR